MTLCCLQVVIRILDNQGHTISARIRRLKLDRRRYTRSTWKVTPFLYSRILDFHNALYGYNIFYYTNIIHASVVRPHVCHFPLRAARFRLYRTVSTQLTHHEWLKCGFPYPNLRLGRVAYRTFRMAAFSSDILFGRETIKNE